MSNVPQIPGVTWFQPRGFASVCRTLKKFLEMHGFKVHWGAWLDVIKDGKLWCDLQVGHVYHHRPPNRGAKYQILYAVVEGRPRPFCKEWLKKYDYVLAQSKFVKQMLEYIDVHAEVMYVGVDTDFFKPMNVPKVFDFLTVGIWESGWDDRKFMQDVLKVTFPFSTYVHTRTSARYEDLPMIYNMARLFISLSGCEGFNIPVVEANACGIPVIYNDAPATNEHVYGIPVKPKEVKEFECGIPFMLHVPDLEKMRQVARETIIKILKNPKEYERMSREARQYALQFDYRKTYRLLLEILTK